MTSNITQAIHSLRSRNLHLQPDHPLCIIKQKVYDYFGESYSKFDNLDAVVSTRANFDDLLIPEDHPCRKRSDTYYIDDQTILRTQTSAHQTEVLRNGYDKFLVTGDVYRKDEVDRTHYPVFHQMEGVCLNTDLDDLVNTMRGLMDTLFPECKCRMNKDYFPFTDPSLEIEVEYNGEWLEVAGCGIIQPQILNNAGRNEKLGGWAFGLGLERLAMILFKIPDIRLFWSQDPKFTSQFRAGCITPFKPFSSLDPLPRDISFFVTDDYEVNEFYDICRDIAGDCLERVERFDKFFHPKKKAMSHAYRLTYSPPDSSLSDPGAFTHMANDIHSQIYKVVREKLNVIIR